MVGLLSVVIFSTSQEGRLRIRVRSYPQQLLWNITSTLAATITMPVFTLLMSRTVAARPLWNLAKRRINAQKALTQRLTPRSIYHLFFSALQAKDIEAITTSVATILTAPLTVLSSNIIQTSAHFDDDGANDIICSIDVAATCIAILIIMLVALIYHFTSTYDIKRIFTRKPKQPLFTSIPRIECIADIIALVCDSHMLEIFRGTQTMAGVDRDKYLGSIGWKYGFGWLVGRRSGRIVLGIDREPIIGDCWESRDTFSSNRYAQNTVSSTCMREQDRWW